MLYSLADSITSSAELIFSYFESLIMIESYLHFLKKVCLVKVKLNIIFTSMLKNYH